MPLLVVVSVPAERDAIRAAGYPGAIEVVGVGPVAAALGTAAMLDGQDGVLLAGIAGGFAPLEPGDLVVGTSAVYADFGADSPDGFIPMHELGFARDTFEADPSLVVTLASAVGARTGAILTVTTVTGTTARALDLQTRYPGALAEAMEGVGVAAAAAVAGVPFVELRAISNVIGPRDRDAWQIPLALTSLGRAVAEFAS